MFIENRIIFGRGSVAVGADTFFRTLILEHIEPPSPVGSTMEGEAYKEKTKHGKLFFVYKEDMKDLMANLKEVSAENPIVEFRGYIFDFTDFNPESVRVTKEMLARAMRGSTLTLAC